MRCVYIFKLIQTLASQENLFNISDGSRTAVSQALKFYGAEGKIHREFIRNSLGQRGENWLKKILITSPVGVNCSEPHIKFSSAHLSIMVIKKAFHRRSNKASFLQSLKRHTVLVPWETLSRHAKPFRWIRNFLGSFWHDKSRET